MELDQVAEQNARSLTHLDGLYLNDQFDQLVNTLYDTGAVAIRRLTLAAINRHVTGGKSEPGVTFHSRNSAKLLESLIDSNLVFGGHDLEDAMDIMGERSQRAVLTHSIIRYNMVDVPTISGAQPQLVAVGSM